MTESFGPCPECKSNKPVPLFDGLCGWHEKRTAKASKERIIASLQPSKAPNKVSTKEKERRALYRAARKKQLEDFPNCERCGTIANQCHHREGRIGDRLYDPENLCSMCDDCHRWAELNPNEAKEQGYSRNRISK